MDATVERIFWDPDYERCVPESLARRIYENLAKNSWFHQTYEEYIANTYE